MHFIELSLTNGDKTLVNMEHVYEVRGTSKGGATLFMIAPSEDGADAIQVTESVDLLKGCLGAVSV